jgi:dTDP-4-amino-4,6-dideoxygalactose transaminase
MSLPFLPFTRPSIDEETIAAVADVMRSGWITSGPRVQAFEAALSDYCGGRPVRVFNSGTATLEVALRLAKVGAGDTVITTPLTWVATANVILEVGATPVLVDVDPVTRNIDLDRIEAAILPNTKAVIPVDLAGLPVDRDRLYAIAGKHNLRVIEDAAQSLGASWNGNRIGSTGDFVSFSFHANKNLTTAEGGALVLPTDIDPGLCERLRLQGVKRFPDGGMDVDVLGGKFNLTDIAATIGLGQMKQLAGFTARRRELARRYFEHRSGARTGTAGGRFQQQQLAHVPGPAAGRRRSRQVHRGDEGKGIGVGVHYPPLHLFSLYRAMGFSEGDFPHAERIGLRPLHCRSFPRCRTATLIASARHWLQVLSEIA